MSDEQINDTTSTAEIVEMAWKRWREFTGYSDERTTFTFDSFSVRDMNESVKEAMRLEPEGTTAYLLLECFLRQHLQTKTLVVSDIMKDYPATMAYLKEAEDLFSVLQSDRALQLASGFKVKLKAAAERYGALNEDVEEMIDNPDALAFLRRDALKSVAQLKPYQFLAGAHDDGPAQVIDRVYMAWNINDMLKALRDMPVNGIAVVLMKDPTHPSRSYFCFALRNGENVIIFTDKNKPVYPGQDDALAARGGRGEARRFIQREHENHFPYQLVKTFNDENGDLHFSKEKSLAAAGVDMVPLMKISELPEFQIIWLTMMMSLISDKFWTKKWQAPELSYTGEMIRKKELLVTDDRGTTLPAAKGYQTIGLEEISPDELTFEAMDPQTERSTRFNTWLEERYRDQVPHDVVNVWSSGPDQTILLEANYKTDDPWRRHKAEPSEVKGEVSIYNDVSRIGHFDKPVGYELKTFAGTDFGTEAELRKDNLWIARYNFSQHIQRSANKEYAQRKKEVAEWYYENVKKNLGNLYPLIAERKIEIESGIKVHGDRFLTFAEIESSEFKFVGKYDNNFGHYTHSGKRECYISEAKASWRALFDPKTAEQLAFLAGCEVSDLPDVLQHWNKEDRYIGNSLLDRLDPMETNVDNPWEKLPLDVNIYLAKRPVNEMTKNYKSTL